MSDAKPTLADHQAAVDAIMKALVQSESEVRRLKCQLEIYPLKVATLEAAVARLEATVARQKAIASELEGHLYPKGYKPEPKRKPAQTADERLGPVWNMICEGNKNAD